MTAALAPTLTVREARRQTAAVALLLPGGKADSFDPVDRHHLAGVRMLPFARMLGRAGRGRLAVWTLRYRVRGWNGAEMSPVEDATWALDEIRRRHGDVPVVLLGHSMGGRTAMRVAGSASVRGVVGLAPWLPDGEPVQQLAGRRVLVIHGSADRVTSPGASRRFVDRAAGVAAEASYIALPGETHAMLLRARTWHRLSTSYAVDVVGLG